jgi:molecular chaperone HscA
MKRAFCGSKTSRKEVAAVPVEALFSISEPGQTKTKEVCKGRAVGIDLGTTNSLVAVVQAGQPVCLAEAGSALLPSVVHYAVDGSIVVGGKARELAVTWPSDTIASVKRFMGRGPGDGEVTRKLTTYRFVPGEVAAPMVRFSVAGGTRAVTPMEVSAEILRSLKARAEAALGGELDSVVITVPAYFDDGQRQATRDAGRLAGLEVMRLLNEPTAAALAYGLDKQAEGTFAVFDLGGGTFDISILKLEAGVFEVKSTGGDSALGGDDFDRAVAGHFLQAMGLPGDAGGDAGLARRVLDAARAAKETLTIEKETSVIVNLPAGKAWQGRLSRAELDDLVRPVLDRCAPPVRRAIRDAGIEAAQLSGVILVGGATRMAIVRRFVAEIFGKQPLADINPDEVVALGAAIQADLLASGGRSDVVLMDVVPLSLGLEMMGGVTEKLIYRNTTVPCGAVQTFTTYADKQTGFDLHVVQGERELVADCRSLARFKLGGIPLMTAGMARLKVTFTVDADGILSVSAREEHTGQEASIRVKPSYGLTDDEVERMVRDAFDHADADMGARLLTVERVEADRILNATRTALSDSAALLVAGEREAIEAAMASLESVKFATNHLAIRAAIQSLDEVSKEFARRRMNQALDENVRGQALDAVERKVTTK